MTSDELRILAGIILGIIICVAVTIAIRESWVLNKKPKKTVTERLKDLVKDIPPPPRPRQQTMDEIVDDNLKRLEAITRIIKEGEKLHIETRNSELPNDIVENICKNVDNIILEEIKKINVIYGDKH
jgi:hypothetical protein